jgi:adenylyltransferase/sulfurtransferase
VNVIASLEAMEALKILTGHVEAINRDLVIVELWDNRLRQVKLDTLRESAACPTCQKREFPWLEGRRGSHTAVLCGRNAVQLSFPGHEPLALDSLEEKLRGMGALHRNRHLLRLAVDGYQLTVFPDGRAIIAGTDDIAEARTVYARYIGS